MAKTFQEMTPEKNGLMIVDAMNLAFRWKHSGAKQFAEQFRDVVYSVANSYGCDKIIITADSKGSNYRKSIYPEYKANRKELQEKQTEEEKEAFKDFIVEYENTLDLLAEHFPVLRFEGVEADDIAAYLIKNISFSMQGNIWLISSDRDWDLLLRAGVRRWSYVNRKEFCTDNWDDHYEVPMSMYLTYKCLIGDSSDNISGVNGIGPKRAAGIISSYGDVFDIYASLPIEGNSKYIKALNEFGDKLLRNQELMDLLTYCEEAIGEDNIKEIDLVIGSMYEVQKDNL